jgi:hypothetical protein
MFSSDDPQQQGLLAAAAGMLNASGPSLMPHSFGQVLGAGLGGYQQGQQQGLDRQKEQMQMQMLQQQVAQATRKNELINNFLAANMDSQSQQGQQPHQAPQSLPMGSTDSDGRTIATPGFFAPADLAQQGVPSPAAVGVPGFGGVPSAAIAADLAFNNGAKMGEWINDRAKPTDFTRLLEQAGIDPNSTLGRQIMQQQIAKQNNIPLQAGRAGAPMYYPDGSIAAMAPIIPKNAVPQIVGGKVVGVSPLTGAAGVEQINAYAERAGGNQAEPIAGYDEQGNPVFTNKFAAAGGGQPMPGPRQPMPGQPGFDVTHMSPEQKKAFYKQAEEQFSLRPGSTPGTSIVRPSLAPGFQKSVEGNVDTMNNDFADLYAANKQAPVTLALLDNIKKLAPAAITGNSADKLAYMNGLLTLGGFQKQKDLATATDLLNKNANMLAINMRLGAGGGGSDALQSLAQAANPNSHMQPEAIAKAADEVAGQVRMRQAQYNNLLPFKMNNDVQGYYGAQKQFSSQADPRNYQPDAQAPAAAKPPAPAAGQTFNMLPAAVQFAGKRMRADNGTIYRSDGTKWIKE